MALTKSFKETIGARADRDPAFRKALLRDYINATVGFKALSQAFGKSSKSLMRMFGPKGNSQASNLFATI